MDPHTKAILVTFVWFFGLILLGIVVINNLPFDYITSAILYLTAVIGAGLSWIGRPR